MNVQRATPPRNWGTSFDDEIDARVLEGQIRAELLDLETLRIWEVNPMIYAGLPGGAIDGLIKRDFAPAADRLRLVIARERQVPALFEAAKANLTRPPKEFTDLAIRMAKGSVGFFEGSVATWAKGAAGADARLREDFDRANVAAIAAAKSFAAWLETDLKPRSNGRYAIGPENFLAKLKHEEMVELPLPELLARGEAQLARDYAAFVETARKIDPGKTFIKTSWPAISDDHRHRRRPGPPSAGRSTQPRRFLVEKPGRVTIMISCPKERRPDEGWPCSG